VLNSYIDVDMVGAVNSKRFIYGYLMTFVRKARA